MHKIGILSDTHGYFHPRIMEFFQEVDEIWHAGDIGNIRVIRSLEALKPVRAVSGNIDGLDVRIEIPEVQLFTMDNVKVLMVHIGGYPGRYDPGARSLLTQEHPGLFVCGHSHILRVMYDERYKVLCINPGAAGKYGIHRSITAVRLVIDSGNMRDLEVLDLPRSP